jgi:predicted PurR-regulated permease PerM
MRTGTYVDQIAAVLGWAGLAVLLYLAYLVVQPFLIPLGWAAVFAIVVYPMHRVLALRWGASWSAVCSTVTIALVLIAPSMLVGTIVAGEAADVAGSIQRAVAAGRLAWVERWWTEMTSLVPGAQQLNLAALAGDAARRGAGFIVGQSGLILRDLALFTFNLVIALFGTFFLLRDSASITRAVRRLLPMHEASREALINRTVELVSVGVVAALAVAAVQGLLAGIAFWAVGIEAPVFWGVVTALFCLLPFGAWIVWLPASVMLGVNGELTRGLILAAAGLFVVSGADNVLRPALMSGRAHMHGLVILVGLLGGVAAFGALGLVLGPVIVATALALITAYVETPPHDSWRV